MNDENSAPDASPPFVHRDLFGGSGEVRVWNLLRAAAAPFSAALACELTPGGRVGAHVQQEFPELVIGLAGEGEALVDGARHRLGPLDVVHLPLGARLELHNRSPREPLRYLIIKARG